MRKFFQIFVALIEIILVLLLAGLVVFLTLNFSPLFRQIVSDFTEPDFVPNQELQDLATKANMTEKARKIFYQTHPQIDEDRQTFEEHCRRPVTQNTVELGCYTSQNRIYILRINEPSLQSEMVVVAAHEMLHAAYERLSVSERNNVNNLLEDAVSYLSSAQLNQEIVSYRINEPGERDNELHSLVGTEYRGLAIKLEKYYSFYFTNRNTVVTYSENFNKVFSDLSVEIDRLRNEIKEMRAEMNFYLRHREIARYNSLVPVINSLISKYNNLVVRYNELSRSLVSPETTVTNQ
jgi:hypothetical protein